MKPINVIIVAALIAFSPTAFAFETMLTTPTTITIVSEASYGCIKIGDLNSPNSFSLWSPPFNTVSLVPSDFGTIGEHLFVFSSLPDCSAPYSQMAAFWIESGRFWTYDPPVPAFVVFSSTSSADFIAGVGSSTVGTMSNFHRIVAIAISIPLFFVIAGYLIALWTPEYPRVKPQRVGYTVKL